VSDGFSQLEDFTAALAKLGELRESGALRVEVSHTRRVRLAIDKAAQYVPPQDGAYLDVLDVLTAIAAGDRFEEFVSARAGANGDAADAERERAAWGAKFEAAAAVFPASDLRPALPARARAAVRQALTAAFISSAKRTGRLGRVMAWYPVRRLLGPHGRRAAWCVLGADIADSVWMGPGVQLRLPRNVTIGAGTKLGGRVMIESFAEVKIGRNVLMNDTDVYSAQHDINHPRFAAQRRGVTIGDYAWLPHKIIILPGVAIGNYAVVGTGSVVSRDVPDYGVAVGNPARVVKQRARIRYTYVPSSVQRPPSIE
jgi:acetyltransferase-like isoleucine patch superfamily enzyme